MQTRVSKKTESVETDSQMIQSVKLADKDFKIDICVTSQENMKKEKKEMETSEEI